MDTEVPNHRSPARTSSRGSDAAALALALLGLVCSPGCGQSDHDGTTLQQTETKPASTSASEPSPSRVQSRASGSTAESTVLTAAQIQEQERTVDQLVAAENARLPKLLERAVDKLRLEALAESGDGYKHADSVHDLVFSGQRVSAASLEGWRGVFQRPSSQAAFDGVLAVLRTHEHALREFEQGRPSARMLVRWNEIAARLSTQVNRFKELRGRCMLPETVASVSDGRVRELRQVVAAQPNELAVLRSALDTTREELATFAVDAANFQKFPSNATNALATVDGMLADLKLVPGQADRQQTWNALAERWNKLVPELNGALDRAQALRREPEFPPHALSTRKELLAWLDAVEVMDRDRASRASALQEVLRSSAAALVELVEAGSAFDVVGAAACDVRSAIDSEFAALEHARTNDRTETVAYHRSFARSLPTDLQTLDALTRLGSNVRTRMHADPNRWSPDTWFAVYADLQDVAFGAIMAGPIGQRADAAVRGWAGLTTSKGWQTFLRSWGRNSMLMPDDQRAFDASLQGWKSAARSVDPRDAAALVAFLGEGPLKVDRSAECASWPSALAAVAAEHRLLALRPGCIEPVNSQLATRVAGFASPADSYHAAIVDRFNTNRDILDVSGMKAVMREERARQPEMWADNDKVYALYADLQDAQLRAYFKAAFSKTLPGVIKSYASGRTSEFKEAARSVRLADAQGMLALIGGEAVDLARLKDWMQASMGYPQVSLTSAELWQALVQALADSNS